MRNLLVSALEKINELQARTITVGQSLPPYLLIGLLWWLSAEADDRARENDLRASMVITSLNQYNTKLDQFDTAMNVRQNCINAVNGRNNNIQNWHDLYEFIRIQSPNATEFADKAQADFDAKPNNQPQTVEANCADFPEPDPVQIPRILIEEGIITDE